MSACDAVDGSLLPASQSAEISWNEETTRVRLWLKADMERPEIDFRFTPNNGHTMTNVRFLRDYVRLAPRTGHPVALGRLPVMTLKRHST